jgi:glycosyltransferase involved in cell wall biosynthesis
MSIQKDLVSIAMTTYNGERFLRKQLDSIYNQSYKNIEVVVCDDRSTDNTIQILEEYRNKYGTHVYVNESNVGFLRNFEKALTLCQGKYIALADQDDIWLPNKIERLVNNIGGFTLIFSDAQYIDENDSVFSPSIMKFIGAPNLTGKPFRILTFGSYITGCTILFKRELLSIALPIPEGECYHDWWLSMIACKQNGIFYINEPLVNYRRHEANTLGGLQIKPKLKGKLFKIYWKQPDRSVFKKAEKRLEKISEARVFNDTEKKQIRIAYEYFHDRLNTKIHLKAFIIALINRKYILPTWSAAWRIRSALSVLVK